MSPDRDTPNVNSLAEANGDHYERARSLLVSNPKQYLIDYIRPKLDGLADSIMFCLFERARYRKNSKIYVPAQQDSPIPRDVHLPNNGRRIHIPGLSFLDFLLLGTEMYHATAGRYKHPEEYPFFGDFIPEPTISRKPKKPHAVPEAVKNVTNRIKSLYVDTILTKICKDGDDDEYGSSSEWDIRCLQDLSKRVHLGYCVAEAKFREDPESYKALAKVDDFEGIKNKLRDIPREQKLLESVRRKGEVYMDETKGEERKPGEPEKPKVFRVDPEIIVALFRDEILPLTIDVEIDYFFRRIRYPIDS